MCSIFLLAKIQLIFLLFLDSLLDSNELHCTLRAKEREVESLTRELCEKNDLLSKYCCQIEELRNEIKNKCKKFNEVIKRLKSNRHDGLSSCENNTDENICDPDNQDLDGLLYLLVRNVEEQRKSVIFQLQSADCQLRAMASEKKVFLKERNEIANQLQCLKTENERLVNEMTEQKKLDPGKEDLLKIIDTLKKEKDELSDKVKVLHDNIQELNTNFKETRWALTSEVAEKHDQVQELRKCVSALEEQLRQADMQTHFKDDIIKELRKELKGLRKSEGRGLYDVVKEVRERKSSKKANISAGTLICESPKSSMNCVFNCKCSASQSLADGKSAHDDDQSENAKLRSEIECLKKCLTARLEQLKDQEDFTRDLEEKLIKAKMDMTSLQEKNNKQQGRNKSTGFTPVTDTGSSRHYALLSCLTSKLEDILKSLCARCKCNTNCKSALEREMDRLRLVKNELEKSKSRSIANESYNSDHKSCNELYRYKENKCNGVHVEDIEKFREKAVAGIVALEKMREQLGILEKLIKTHQNKFACNCDNVQLGECEEKLEKFRAEFDAVSGELCSLLRNVSKPCLNDSADSFQMEQSTCTDASLLTEEISRLRCECSRLENEINNQENVVDCLKRTAKDLEQEIRCKRMQLAEQTSEIESKGCEIIKARNLIKKVSRFLRDKQCSRTNVRGESSPSPKNAADLSMLLCELNELWCLLEKSTGLINQKSAEASERILEENEKLKGQLNCLEKCVLNKDETLRVLQDTVKLKECHIEELKSKMESYESQSTKLNRDVEEKCRLIANLQEAIRKCKQLEAYKAQVETLQFELCDLDCTLKKYDKEIRRKNNMIETLHEKLTDVSSTNLNLTEKMNIIEPKLKIVYKTCDLFEQMICNLQGVIQDKEEEIECLYGKIKELEDELEAEFKNCECRAAEDSKCIEDLNLRLRNFQNEYTCAQESYNASLILLENRLKNEEEAGRVREAELGNTISQLKVHLKSMQNQTDKSGAMETSRINELETLLKQAKCRLEMYDVRILDLQKALEFTALEKEEERKNMLRKLSDERKENIKNETLITKLNESIKLNSLNEKIIQEKIENFMEDNECLRVENEELRSEIEAWKKLMSADENANEGNFSELEKLICCLKIQKSELKSKCSHLKAEIEKEVKLRKLVECQAEDLERMLQNKSLEFNHMIQSYKCTSSRLQQTLAAIKEVEKNFMCIENKMRDSLDTDPEDEIEYLKKLLNIKTAENAKLICQLQVLQVEMESMQNESIILQTNNDSIITQLRHEVCRLENAVEEFQIKSRKLDEENVRLRRELNSSSEKELSIQMEFKEKQKELCGKLRNTICEKNELLNSLDELQKRLEQLCLDNVSKEKINRELLDECERLRSQYDSSENYMKNKSDKIISSLNKEIKTLHCEISTIRENYEALDKDYKDLLNEYKCCEKKKCNLEKLYMEASNENQALVDLKLKYERELCELNTQNLLLKDKLVNLDDSGRNTDLQNLCEKLKELTMKTKTLEKRIIPDLEEEIASKNCCIENLTIELREANISSQRMRTEAMRVMQCTKKYLAAQRCANEALKSRLECSNKRGNILGAENRELEEQLKAVSRMNEFLLNHLESNKCDTIETEPRSFSPLPWSSTVERDTSSSEYLAESGFQSMQPSPTNMDIDYDTQNDSKRINMQWNSSRKSKCGGLIDCPSYRHGVK